MVTSGLILGIMTRPAVNRQGTYDLFVCMKKGQTIDLPDDIINISCISSTSGSAVSCKIKHARWQGRSRVSLAYYKASGGPIRTSVLEMSTQ